MNCPPCGTANSGGRRFCAECGSPLALACSSCGFSNESGVKFCGRCGAALAASPVPETRKFGTLETHTPKHLAEKILSSKNAIEEAATGPVMAPVALWLLADIASHPDRFDVREAERCYREALAAADGAGEATRHRPLPPRPRQALQEQRQA
jgi:hypothetical protein